MEGTGGKAVRQSIARVRRRIRFQQFLLGLAILVPIALAIRLAQSVLTQFAPALADALSITVIVWAVAGLALLIWFTVRRTGEKAVALAIDHRADLADRVTSAAEFDRLDTAGPVHAAQVADAGNAVSAVDLPPLFPFPLAAFARRLAPVLLLAPLIFLVSRVHLPDLFASEEPPAAVEEQFAEAAPEEEIELLEETGFDQEMLQLIQPAEELIREWKEQLERIERSRAESTDLFPEPESSELLPVETIFEARSRPLPEPKERAVTPVKTDQEIRIADVSAFVDKEADGEYAEAFAHMDKTAFGEKGITIKNTEDYAEQMAKQSQMQTQAGQGLRASASYAANMDGEDAAQGQAMRNQTQGAQMESFAEFLQEYAAHLNRMLAKMGEVIQQTEKESEHPQVDETFRFAEAIPKDAPRMQLTEVTEKDLREGVIRRLSPEEAGDSRAGTGFGTKEGVFKVAKVERQATEYAELDAEFGEGQTFQILEDLEEGDAAGYAGLFQKYAVGAEDLLSQEDIPAAIKNFVREYFLAISPTNIEKK